MFLRFFRSGCQRALRGISAILVIGLIPALAVADQPLHATIDQLIAAGTPNFQSLSAPQATDAEFLRRIYLDLIGALPTSAAARAFFADTDPAKREKLIDQLLSQPEFARHMQQMFDIMLMERRPDKHIPTQQWQEYLLKSFSENKSLAQLVSEILSADGADLNLRPAAKFYLDREGETNLVTRDIGRIFLGRNLQCSQCHDHPLVFDYVQDDYYGIYAFLSRSFVFTDKEKKGFLAERAEGDVSYVSVFDPEKKKRSTGPRLPSADPLAEPTIDPNDAYQVKSAEGVRPVPKYSRRAQLGNVLPTADNPLFKRNMANRLWALMMGRGLVHPLDLHHAENPPSNPELLESLGNGLAAMNFNIRAFIKQVALSQAYQRSCLPSQGAVEAVPDESFAVALLKPMLAEQLALSMMQAAGFTDMQRRALGDQLSEQTLYERLKGNVDAFVSIFGSSPGVPEEGIQPTMNQALFLSNDGMLRSWLQPTEGNLLYRLQKLSEVHEIADELFLSVLTRYPNDEEKAEVTQYLAQRSEERVAALQELAWALLTSTEFRFNH